MERWRTIAENNDRRIVVVVVQNNDRRIVVVVAVESIDRAIGWEYFARSKERREKAFLRDKLKRMIEAIDPANDDREDEVRPCQALLRVN